MPNTSRPKGFEPFGRAIRMNEYVAGGTVYPGDAVKLDDTGRIVVAAATNALCGVAVHKATAGQYVMIWDHPDQYFVGEADDATINEQLDLNLNYNIVAGSPNTTYDISRHVIDASSQATTGTLPLKVLALHRSPDNELGDKGKFVFKINNHQFGSHTGTDGV
jgi:hypothetical protein